ncbi:ribonuclease H1 domain-containing protein [Lutispora thermophila]|uniref:ribonuclease H n=1 Tax=Lutispora thermophila DSM 19022 TaxID=1122184 RepID=A0A1M6DNS9_9FIRM|nr:ribonuclease H family protein [Lutispora thermophila]SHI74906.1 ribonuclease HI [Lutispora thermophila DSM 19022]
MSKKKYYGVRSENITGVFETWEECKSSIEGVKSVKYKAFPTFEEADAFAKGIDISNIHIQTAAESNSVIAYVDGSYDGSQKRYSFGCVIITPQGKIICEKGSNEDPEALTSRNVAGELMGTMFAVRWAYSNGYYSILIRHDYEGIAKWFTGQWKANSYCAKKYIEYMGKYRNAMNISFQKVTAHSGDKYNEMADELAKKALMESKI